MADKRFFDKQPACNLEKLAEIAKASLYDPADASIEIHDIAPLNMAEKGVISFLEHAKYSKDFQQTKAEAVICRLEMAAQAPKGTALLISDQPYHGFARMASYFYPVKTAQAGIHPTADIHPDSHIDASAQIGAYCVVGRGAYIGVGTILEAHSIIAPAVRIGDYCHIGMQVSIEFALIGNHCQFHAGARIGTRGFGFAMDKAGHIELPQLGLVRIGDHVEIGANCCIDRGMGADTVIGDHCRLDNMVQIAHNVVLGKGCVMASQVGISGSTQLGDHVVAGGQTGMAGHLKLGSNIMIAGKSGVTKNIASNQVVGGFPAIPIRKWRKQEMALRRLGKKKHDNII